MRDRLHRAPVGEQSACDSEDKNNHANAQAVDEAALIANITVNPG